MTNMEYMLYKYMEEERTVLYGKAENLSPGCSICILWKPLSRVLRKSYR